MRLAVVNITGGGFSGGYQKYLKNMLPRLSAHHDISALMCSYPRKNDIPKWFQEPLKIEFCPYDAGIRNALLSTPSKELRGHLKNFSPDIIFLPGARFLNYKNIPLVNMLQNMEPFVEMFKGDPYQERIKKVLLRILGKRAARKASHTIAISNYVREFIMGPMEGQADKISLIYHGVSQLPEGLGGTRPRSLPEGWENEFIFSGGSIRPARGLEDAVSALCVLKKRGFNFKLFIAGELSPHYAGYVKKLKHLLKLTGIASHVCWAGHLNDDEMLWCFKKSLLFIMTSRVEACPNIALEAMASGSVIVSADNPPLPEMFSQCARYYQSGNGESLAEVSLDILTSNTAEKKQLSDSSHLRSTLFSWDIAAEKTVSVLKNRLPHRSGN
jgi:glycosyltransferase involved in cell wall biosynthesis